MGSEMCIRDRMIDCDIAWGEALHHLGRHDWPFLCSSCAKSPSLQGIGNLSTISTANEALPVSLASLGGDFSVAVVKK